MNWDAIGAIAELLGAAGVIATLLYLAKQIGQNSMMMRATIKQEQASAVQQTISLWVDHPDLWMKIVNDQELTEQEDVQAGWLLRAGFRGFESHCHQAELGLLDEKEWTALKSTIQSFCQYPKVREHYLKLGPQLSERLRTVVDPVIQENEQ